jgi:hypothetical protein
MSGDPFVTAPTPATQHDYLYRANCFFVLGFRHRLHSEKPEEIYQSIYQLSFQYNVM